MPVKTLNTRIKSKIDVTSQLTSFVPLRGEMVIGGQVSSGTTLGNNTDSKPYILKIGDGTTTWGNLPAVGTIILEGTTITSTSSSGTASIALTIPADKKRYGYIESTFSGIEDLNITISGTNPFLGEHYLLIKNTGTADIYLNNITASFNSSNAIVNTRHEYITAGDICELQIKVFMIGNQYYATVIPQLGIMQSVDVDGVWNVNRN